MTAWMMIFTMEYESIISSSPKIVQTRAFLDFPTASGVSAEKIIVMPATIIMITAIGAAKYNNAPENICSTSIVKLAESSPVLMFSVSSPKGSFIGLKDESIVYAKTFADKSKKSIVISPIFKNFCLLMFLWVFKKL